MCISKGSAGVFELNANAGAILHFCMCTVYIALCLITEAKLPHLSGCEGGKNTSAAGTIIAIIDIQKPTQKQGIRLRATHSRAVSLVSHRHFYKHDLWRGCRRGVWHSTAGAVVRWLTEVVDVYFPWVLGTYLREGKVIRVVWLFSAFTVAEPYHSVSRLHSHDMAALIRFCVSVEHYSTFRCWCLRCLTWLSIINTHPEVSGDVNGGYHDIQSWATLLLQD